MRYCVLSGNSTLRFWSQLSSSSIVLETVALQNSFDVNISSSSTESSTIIDHMRNFLSLHEIVSFPEDPPIPVPATLYEPILYSNCLLLPAFFAFWWFWFRKNADSIVLSISRSFSSKDEQQSQQHYHKETKNEQQQQQQHTPTSKLSSAFCCNETLTSANISTTPSSSSPKLTVVSDEDYTSSLSVTHYTLVQ
jgi:hypothetical protein